jgi:hypothetical protein
MAKLHTLMCSIDAAHPRSYPEYINVGFEYKFKNFLSARYGYMAIGTCVLQIMVSGLICLDSLSIILIHPLIILMAYNA